MNFQRPLDSYIAITNEFREGHRGTDYAAPMNSPVFAIADGVVEKSAWDLNGYGNRIVIRHNELWRSLYAHLSELHVAVGREVEAGKRIGLLGSTGNSSGPHLHLEIWQKIKYYDPETLFPEVQKIAPVVTEQILLLTGYIKVSVEELNIREIPTTMGEIVGKLKCGDYRKIKGVSVGDGGIWLKLDENKWCAAWYPGQGWLVENS